MKIFGLAPVAMAVILIGCWWGEPKHEEPKAAAVGCVIVPPASTLEEKEFAEKLNVELAKALKIPLSASEEASFNTNIIQWMQKLPDNQGVCHMVLKTAECLAARPDEVSKKMALDLNAFATSASGPCSGSGGQVHVEARPVKIDFKPRPQPPTPGCVCGARDDIVFGQDAGGQFFAKANEEFAFRYDAVHICRGQSFDHFHGTISWGNGQTTDMANNNDNGTFPGIAGTLLVKFSKPGDFNVVADISLDCFDSGPPCRSTCSTRGTTQIHITQ